MSPPKSAWLKLAGVAVCLALALCSLLIFRVHSAAAEAMERSDAAFDRGSLKVALSEAHEAALWYLPLSAHQHRSYERLRAIALGAESGGNTRLARRAWAAIRGALIETSQPWAIGQSDRSTLLREANEQLARLLSSAGPAEEQTKLKTTLLESYQAESAPPAQRTLGRSLGMGLMLLTGLVLVFGQRVRWPRSVVFAPFTLGFLFWLFSAVGA